MNNDLPMEMRDIQKVSLQILKFVSALCEREGFRYSLMYGTLIGAIRHKGFIPWDDDVDIMMPRPDYERFLQYCATHTNELGFYKIYNSNTHKNYNYGITRVCDSRYEIIEMKANKNCGMGIFIDVYPYDGLGNNLQDALELLTLSRHYCDTIADIISVNHSVLGTLNCKGKIVYVYEKTIKKMRGTRYYLNKLSSLCKDHSYDNSIYVGPLMWYFAKPHRVLFKKELFDELIKVPFEDGLFCVPKNYHDLLTLEYGDYMQLPPVEKRIYHHQYKAYKRLP